MIRTGEKELLKFLTHIAGRIVVYTAVVIFLLLQLKRTKVEVIVSEKVYPVKAVEYIKENLDTKKIKLFNEYNFGSYLLYQDIPVFIDSRADVYDPAFNGWEDDIFRDFMDLTSAKDYENKFTHYGITHVLIYENSTLGKVLKENKKYKKLYSDDTFILFERTNT